MALFRVSNERAQFDAAGNEATDQYGAGIRFTQSGNARVTTGSATNYNQGIPMSSTGQVAIVDATAGLPAGTIFHNGLPISADKVCVSRNATAVVSNGTPYDSAGAVAADINLDLNFIGTDTLNSSVTFTRASTGTFFNSAGVLTSAAINAPRFDYNPATLAARGLLVEEARTNLLTFSEQFDNASGWTSTRASVSANATTAPTGTSVADKIVEDTTASNTHLTFSADVSVSTATVYTYSVYAKAAGRTWFNMQIATGTGAYGATVPFCYFNLSGVGAVGTGANGTGSITAVGNGWYRCVLVAVATTSASTTNMRIKLATGDGIESYTGDGASGIFVFGAQLEAGAFPTSYIPTTTTALTRAADVATINTLAPWYNAAAGTVYAELQRYALIPSTAFANAWALSDNTSNERFLAYNTGSVQTMDLVVTDGGSGQATLVAPGSITANTTIKTAFAYAANDFAFVRDAGVVQTDTSGSLPTVDRLYIGANATGGGQWTGYLRRISYFPRRLSNAELQTLTT